MWQRVIIPGLAAATRLACGERPLRLLLLLLLSLQVGRDDWTPVLVGNVYLRAEVRGCRAGDGVAGWAGVPAVVRTHCGVRSLHPAAAASAPAVAAAVT